tara:strand:+ start:1098 stop:1253 length:156 start_codon:yes stop_codon:yes gene_type:complete
MEFIVGFVAVWVFYWIQNLACKAQKPPENYKEVMESMSLTRYYSKKGIDKK